MTQIKDYVLLLVGACLICGGLTILAPSGQFERIIQIIGSVFLFLCMLSPLSGTLDQVFDYENNSQLSDKGYQSPDAWEYSTHAMTQTLKDTINSYVTTVIGHKAQSIEITMNHNNNTFELSDIQITVLAEDIPKKSAIADYVSMKIGIRPTVISQSMGE